MANTVAYFDVATIATRGLYYKTLGIRNLRENDIFRSKLMQSSLDKHTRLDKQKH